MTPEREEEIEEIINEIIEDMSWDELIKLIDRLRNNADEAAWERYQNSY